MFSGIVQATGKVHGVRELHNDEQRLQLDIEVPRKLIRKVRRGASIAVQGVCLTATNISYRRRFFTADVITPTYDRTTVGQWHIGKIVNLELALSVGMEVSGHIVQGHITGVATVKQTEHDANRGGRCIEFAINSEQRVAIIDQGSIAIDGVSLTIASCNEECFMVGIIPYTWQYTTLGLLTAGNMVNIETDLFLRAALQQLRPITAQAMERR